jgi:hypothetical protein
VTSKVIWDTQDISVKARIHLPPAGGNQDCKGKALEEHEGEVGEEGEEEDVRESSRRRERRKRRMRWQRQWQWWWWWT